MSSTTRCLAVDDHPTVRQGLGLMFGLAPDLELVGSVQNGEDVIEAVQRLRPEVVIMDVRLPGIDGMEAFQKLRESPPTAATPVVAVTAFAMKDDRERVLRAGFNGYLEKPISVRELPQQVRAFLTGMEPNDDR
jgi:DNA-binding NarL/FixJ family response regulator